MWAYDFECDMTMAEIISALNESGPWQWVWRDKDAFGPYISSVPREGVSARIYDLDGYYSNGPTYTADFKLAEGCQVEWATIDRVFRELLRNLPVRNVAIGEGYD
jgi:hypothetical protein